MARFELDTFTFVKLHTLSGFIKLQTSAEMFVDHAVGTFAREVVDEVGTIAS